MVFASAKGKARWKEGRVELSGQREYWKQRWKERKKIGHLPLLGKNGHDELVRESERMSVVFVESVTVVEFLQIEIESAQRNK